MAQLEYLTKIMRVIEKIDKEQSENIQAAADLCAATIHSDKLVHLFGSGHSVLPVQDVFPRYGGVVGWHPVMDPRLMWNNVIGPGGAVNCCGLSGKRAILPTSSKATTSRRGKS